MLKNCKSNIGKDIVEEYYKTEYWPVIGRNVKYKVVKYVNKGNNKSEILHKYLIEIEQN
jgi:hypothetical protein